MPFEISHAASQRYQIVRVTGLITPEVARAMALETVTYAAETGIQARLFDVRGGTNVSSPSNIYDLAYTELEELGVSRATKAAILVSPHDASHDFVETALRNSGFNARKFTDEATAIAWLAAD